MEYCPLVAKPTQYWNFLVTCPVERDSRVTYSGYCWFYTIAVLILPAGDCIRNVFKNTSEQFK
jgi:hypothetical protein